MGNLSSGRKATTGRFSQWQGKIAPVIRKCMKCREKFNSQGDRICPGCSKDNLNVGRRIGF